MYTTHTLRGWAGGQPSQPRRGAAAEGGWVGKNTKMPYKEEMQKLKRASTSICKGRAQEFCNRIWVFILRPRLALPRRQGTLILPLPAYPPNPTHSLPWCNPETR